MRIFKVFALVIFVQMSWFCWIRALISIYASSHFIFVCFCCIHSSSSLSSVSQCCSAFQRWIRKCVIWLASKSVSDQSGITGCNCESSERQRQCFLIIQRQLTYLYASHIYIYYNIYHYFIICAVQTSTKTGGESTTRVLCPWSWTRASLVYTPNFCLVVNLVLIGGIKESVPL